MKDSHLKSTGHPPEKLIAAYAIGKCSPIEQAEIDEHCFTCEKCRTRLSILLRLCALDGNDEERRELERLFPLGMEVISQIRHPEEASISPLQTKSQQYVRPGDTSKSSTATFTSDSFYKDKRKRSFYYAVGAVLVLAIAGAAYLWYQNKHSALQNSLLAMQRSYPTSRPLESRMTGDFAYKPYARTRGELDNHDINRDQLNYALLELTRIVASTPTPQERHALGRLYLFLGEFDKAESQMKLALESLNNDAKILTDIAALYYERSKFADSNSELLLTKAVEYYRQAISIDPQLAEAWFNRALCYEHLAAYSNAKEDWKQYLKIDPDSEWAKEARERLKNLETKAQQLFSPKKSETKMAEDVASKNDEQLKELISQNFVDVKQYSTGQLFDDYLSAELNGNQQRAEQCITTLRRIGTLTTEVKGDKYIADLALLAARASPKIKSGMLDVRLMLRQADNEYDRSSHDTAFKLYKQAYNAAERIGDHLHAELAASKFIRYSNSRAQTEPLITLGNRLLIQTEQRRHLHLQAVIHASLANGFLAAQQGSLALENGLRAAEIAKDLGDINTTINGLMLAGSAYTRSGNYERAFNKSFEVLSILGEHPVDVRKSFQAYQQAWESLFRIGNFHLAMAYQQEAMEIARKTGNQLIISGTLGRLGLNSWKLGQNDVASSLLKEAIEKCNSINDQTSRKLLQADLYTVLGDIELSLGEYEKSLTNYQNAMHSVTESNNFVYLATISQGKAAAFLAQNRVSEAESELQKSISLIENDRKNILDAGGRSIFLARSQSAYNAMIDLQYKHKQNPALAFNYAEVVKSRDVLDSLTNRASTKEIDGRLEIALSGNARPLKLQQIQRSLPNHIQVLSYSMTENDLIIWYITNNTFYSTSVGITSNQFKNLALEYLSSIRTKAEMEKTNRLASDLYRYLILPVADKLDNNRLLCIIPDSGFNKLPFSALFSASKNRYLIEDYSIITSPSASILLQTINLAKEKPALPTQTFVGLSNPRFSSRLFPGLPTLPSSEEEVARASQLYKHGIFFSQENATESQAIQQFGHHNIVHIASHTLINEQIPLLSAILLSDEKLPTTIYKGKSKIAFDGKLQAAEIYQMSFPQTRLVVLSSCRSALGNNNQGQAIGALAQAFFAAKVPSVLASLWDIDDAKSAELMLAFHQYHKTQLHGFSQSLRLAQCSFLYGNDIEKRHPYYWAAFQLFGCDSGDPTSNH
ncbi:MAG: CHAT domain-containing protein [Acidobacteria bacterium]|nr:CHAT domain-containing protein [Acidobacteriota bacterium]